MMKSNRMRWVRHVERMGNMRSGYKILVGKRKGKRPFGRPMHRWKDNITMDLKRNKLEGCGLDASGSG